MPKYESLYDPNLLLFDGFTCRFRDLLTISSQVIARHVSAKHNRMRLELQVKPKAIYEPVYLQAWTRNPTQALSAETHYVSYF
ncbi:Uncharacterized protein HZ326_24180 [Fusarium oxysporum f. sp. albedinis]|nr:Uncharacterized protein HZ326_24180 [Fusarium oxysporum f. sp. albedinis]